MEDCTHEKKILYGDLDFLNFVYKRFGINRRVPGSIFTSFQTFFYKGISFVKLTLPHFFEQNWQLQSLWGYGFFEFCIQHFWAKFWSFQKFRLKWFFYKIDPGSHPRLVLHVLCPRHPRLVLHVLCPTLRPQKPYALVVKVKWKVKKWKSEKSEVMTKTFFDLPESDIYYISCIYL